MTKASPASTREFDAVLALKAAPPRPRKDIVNRPRLDRWVTKSKVPVLMIQAPMGYGKTLLLAQWRRTVLDAGMPVAWLSVDDRDESRRLVEGIVLSIRRAIGRDDFCIGIERNRREADWYLRAAAEILGEWAQLTRPLVLILDDFDRLRDAQAHAVGQYLIANIPANGRLFIGARAVVDTPWVLELQAYNHVTIIRRHELAFTFDESVAFLQQRLDPGLSSDIAARIHDLTAGWPIGLELSASSALDADDPAEALSDVQHQWRKVSGNLVEWVTAAWSDEMKSFLVEISILSHLNADLCVAVTGRANAGQLVEHLRARSGLLLDAEDNPWFRLHHLAADHLRSEAARLPKATRDTLHAKAAEWLIAHGFWADAAAHALEAGQTSIAFDAMEHSLRSMISVGKFDIVDNWLSLLPPDEIARRQRFRLSAATRLAIRGLPHFAAMIADFAEADDPRLRFAAAVVHTLAASHADDPDAGSAALAGWSDPTITDDPQTIRTYNNMRRWLDSFEGESANAEDRDMPDLDEFPLSGSITLHRQAVARLRAGFPREAADLLRPGLAKLEATLGRRSTPALMVAVTLASVVLEQDDFPTTRVLIADRLDLIDPGLLPDGLGFGFTAAAALAHHDGQTDRAFDLLRLLLNRAEARELPRIQAVALGALVKLHLQVDDVTAATQCMEELSEIDSASARRNSLNLRWIRVSTLAARGRLSLAQRDVDSALQVSEAAIVHGMRVGHRVSALEARFVRAAANVLRGAPQPEELDDLVKLAKVRGLSRMLRQADDVLIPYLESARMDAPLHAAHKGTLESDRTLVSATLTAREADVLALLTRGLSNKQIATELQIGEGTIKWHLKNLFLKFDATERKHLIARARLLGLIQA